MSTAPANADPLCAPLDAGFWPKAWLTWGAVTVSSFALLETAALLSEPGPKTLSAQLRRQRHISAAAIGIGALWLVHHIGLAGDDTTT